MDLSKKWVMVIIAVFCALLWGSAFPTLKLSYTELGITSNDIGDQMWLAGLRFLFAGLLVLAGLLLFKRSALRLSRRQYWILFIFGIVQTTLQYLFFYVGVSNTSGVQASIIISSNTFFTILLAHFIYANDRLGWQKWLGLAAGFTGIFLANWGQSFDGSFQWMGEGFLLLSAFTSAVGTIMAKEMGKGIHPFTMSGWQLTLGAILLLLTAIPFADPSSLTWTPFAYGLLVYMVLISAVAFALWFAVLQYHKASHVGIYKFFVPVSGVGLSVWLLPGETFTLPIVFALGFVAFGIYIVNKS